MTTKLVDVVSFRDYRKFLLSLVKENKGNWGFQSRMAEAAGCQRSYLSQVLKGRSILTLDQAARICDFLKFDEDQTTYFLDLVSLERAVAPNLKRLIEKRLSDIQAKREDLSKRYREPPKLMEAVGQIYYSAWIWQAVHILVGIAGHDTASAIACRLGMPVDYIESTLCSLQSMGLVRMTHPGRWEVASRNIHLPKDSPLISMSHQNWRQQAILDSQRGNRDSLHYTSVQSHSMVDFRRLKGILIEAIDKSRAVIGESPSEELTCMTCDFFVVGAGAPATARQSQTAQKEFRPSLLN